MKAMSMRAQMLNLFLCFLLVFGCGMFAVQIVAAQDDKAAAEAAAKEAKRRAEAEEAIRTLASILESKKEQAAKIKSLKADLRAAKEEASKAELEEEIKKENAKLAELEKQTSALMTGTTGEGLNENGDLPFNLQGELEGLVQPFIKMMKDATENARKIEELKDKIALAQKRQQVASRAIGRLTLLGQIDKEASQGKGPASRLLADSLKEWQDRATEAINLEESSSQQLKIRLEEDAAPANSMAGYATSFFQERGLNFLLAIGAAGLVFLISEIISRSIAWARRRQGFKRNFWTRLASLVFRVVSIVIAFLAMVIVFNAMNDWLLLGVASLFALGAAWLGLTMLPSIVEQVTLLLNLGAVQEDERVMIDGVPWRVNRLDFYTDLINPALDGGHFQLPVRELVGMHSRPSGPSEPWFSTKKGDWVLIDDSEFGQVVSQTPELVQVKERGGALVTYETAAFLAKAPRNLSTGFRMQTEFGLDYRHQGEATNAIPSLLREHVEKGLISVFGEKAVSEIDVDLLRAADSAIIFEVETIFPGHVAPRYEDIEREIARLLVEACNKHGWTIPFPQMVMHQPTVS